MQVVYLNRVNYLAEAADMILRSKTPNKRYLPHMMLDILPIAKRKFKDGQRSDEEMERFLQAIGNPVQEVISHAMKAVKKLPQDKLAPYFAPVFQGGTSIATVICEGLSLLDGREYELLSDRERQLFDLTLLSFCSADSIPYEEPLPSLVQALDGHFSSDSERWNLMLVCSEFPRLSGELAALLEPVVKALSQKADILEKLYADAIEAAQERIQGDAQAYFLSEWNLSLSMKYDLVFAPRVMRFNEFTFYRTPWDQRVELGIACESWDASGAFSQTALVGALKALGDKRRMEIMALLKERPHYGNELAEKLDLTPATISHHMDILFSSQLLLIEYDGTKVVYSVAANRIRQLADALLSEIT